MQAVSENAVVDFLTDVKFFSQYSSDRGIISEFASQLEMRKMPKDFVIYKTEDIGHSFYIVLWGEVVLLNDQIMNSNGRNKILCDPNYKSIQRFGRGQVFGEETVEEGNKKSIERTLNAVCSQDTTLLVMRALDYHKIAKNYDKELRKEMKKTLMNCKPFSNFDSAKIDYIVTKMKLKYYDMASEVLTSGEHVKNLCIVRNGVVKLVRTLPKPSVNCAVPEVSMLPTLNVAFNKSLLSKSSSAVNSLSPTMSSSASVVSRVSTARSRKGDDDGSTSGVGVGSASLSGLGPPGLWVIEKSWREHSEGDKRKASKR